MAAIYYWCQVGVILSLVYVGRYVILKTAAFCHIFIDTTPTLFWQVSLYLMIVTELFVRYCCKIRFNGIINDMFMIFPDGGHENKRKLFSRSFSSSFYPLLLFYKIYITFKNLWNISQLQVFLSKCHKCLVCFIYLKFPQQINYKQMVAVFCVFSFLFHNKTGRIGFNKTSLIDCCPKHGLVQTFVVS